MIGGMVRGRDRLISGSWGDVVPDVFNFCFKKTSCKLSVGAPAIAHSLARQLTASCRSAAMPLIMYNFQP